MIKTHPLSAIAAFVCSCLAVVVLAYLILFASLQTCSATNIVIFIVLLGVSILLVFSGMAVGANIYRKTKNSLALTSLLFTFLYVGLLLYLIQLMY